MRAALAGAALLLGSVAWAEEYKDPTWYQAAGSINLGSLRPLNFTLDLGGDPLVVIGMDGKITYGANYEPDEAARAFWEAVSRNAPCREVSRP